MNHSRQFDPDELAVLDGETGFIGVNERLHASQIPPGFLASGKNIRCTQGKVEPRKGIGILPFGPTNGKTAFTDAYDQGYVEWYDPTDKIKWLIVAANGKVYKTAANRVAEEVTLPAGVTLTASTFKMFVACKNQLVILRGEDEDPLVCEDLTVGFTVAEKSPVGDGTEAMPRSSFGIFFANRLILIYDYDKVAVSDNGDVTRFTFALSAFQINEGDNDELVSIAQLNESNLLFLKENSVWQVTNIGGDIAQAVGPLLVTDQYGCSAPHSTVRVGADLWWWSDAGMVSVGLTSDNEAQGREIRLTDDLEVTLRRINLAHQGKITTGYHDGKVYIAVPLDDAKVLGDEMIPSATSYSAAAALNDPGSGIDFHFYNLSSLTIGSRYQYTQGSGDDGGFSHDSVYYLGSIDFEATVQNAVLLGNSETTIDASLKEVLYDGVLNGVLVYDTRQGAWAGVDESEATRVMGFVRHNLYGEERLTFLSTDGWLRIYDQGYEDETEQDQTPWIDVLPVHYTNIASVTALVVNSGTSVAAAASETNTSSTWGTQDTLADAASNLWQDSGGQGGYDQSATSPWTAPNTTPSQISGGVRFLSTNGALPSITVNGGAAISSSGFAGPSDSIYFDVHPTSEIQPLAIESEWTTRAYQVNDVDRNQFQSALVMLETWAPSYTLTTIIDGVGKELDAHTAKTRDRTAYTAAGKGTWSADNANDDHADPGREDYSMTLAASGVLLGLNGINFELHQDTTARVPLSRSSHWMQLKLSNTQGRTVMRAVKLESVTADRPSGVTAH